MDPPDHSPGDQLAQTGRDVRAADVQKFADLLGIEGVGETKSKAWTWAIVRLIPQAWPISPQWSTNFCAAGVRFTVRFALTGVTVSPEILLTGVHQRQEARLTPHYIHARSGGAVLRLENPFCCHRRVAFLIAGAGPSMISLADPPAT